VTEVLVPERRGDVLVARLGATAFVERRAPVWRGR
jgi:hypothetical protein